VHQAAANSAMLECTRHLLDEDTTKVLDDTDLKKHIVKTENVVVVFKE
jgi:hypothetical protein